MNLAQKLQCTVAAVGMGLAVNCAAATFFVATNGNDAWSGQLPAPNRGKTDGPFATITAAQRAVRALPEAQRPGTSVYLRGGRYFITQPIVFGPEDSGTKESPIVYAAYQIEKPVIDGGRGITGIGYVKSDPFWHTSIPEVRAGQWYFSQLFVNGQRRTRARIPNAGYFRMDGQPAPLKDAQGKEIPNKSRFIFRETDLTPWGKWNDQMVATVHAFSNWDDVNLVLMHSWENSIHRLKPLDEKNRIVELAFPCKEWWTIGYWEKPARYYFENVREDLDTPGEWYLDRHTGELSYYPKPGEAIGALELSAPVVTELVRFDGAAEPGRMVRGILFKGITFQHADWTLKPEGNSSTQAAVDVPAAITANYAQDCGFEDCTFAHIGSYAVSFRRGCKNCYLARNHFYDLGAGAVRIGEPEMPKADAAETSGTVVDNNYIHHLGEVYPAGLGVLILQSSDNRVSHNEIHDTYYTAISVGWNWGQTPTRAHRNIIEYNHLHHLLRGVLSDGAGIYTLGSSPGTVLRNNVIHDVFSYEQPLLAWGIYLDAESNQILVESNLCYNIQNGGLMFHNGSFENTVRNNIFARAARELVWRALPKGGPSVFERNICYVSQGHLFLRDGRPDLKSRWDNNLYWRTDGEELLFNGLSLEEWQKLGLDAHSLVADPLFVAPDKDDFRLKPSSPAIPKLGFQPFDPGKAGLYGDRAWTSLPRKAKFAKTVMPPPPPLPKPTPIAEGFEQTAVGQPPANAQCFGRENGGAIVVTDEQAAAGRHSLKIVDAPDVKNSWDPHFFYTPHFKTGVMQASFKLFLEPGALPVIEWRNGASPYNTGPLLRVDAQRNLYARDKLIAKLPERQWVGCAWRCTLGKEALGKYDLKVSVPGQPAAEFKDLPCDANFRELEWWGFVSMATNRSVFYVDDIVLSSGKGK